MRTIAAPIFCATSSLQLTFSRTRQCAGVSALRRWSGWLGGPVLPLVVTLAAALRLGAVLLSPGGLLGVIGYDPGVYYSSAAAITFGRLPYDDYVLLHPPGLSLVLVPFALVGRLTTDHIG